MRIETIKQQTNGPHKIYEKIVDSANQNQIISKNIDDTIRISVDKAVMIVGNRKHDAILTAMDKMVDP